ncbi:YheV family putative metal-binding protein, partial [Thalassolituus sp. UBA2009]|uniref:YheV family putative zinc ribbon protein n=1 Tax=Thalassolituus sp. UBA2009 TaxID=1947658 RepID=UPI00257CF11A
AGAVCPKCSEMDKTVMYSNDDGEEVRECISCGFSQTTTEQAQEDQQTQELVTRVTPDGKPILDDGEQPLKILGLSPSAVNTEADSGADKK